MSGGILKVGGQDALGIYNIDVTQIASIRATYTANAYLTISRNGSDVSETAGMLTWQGALSYNGGLESGSAADVDGAAYNGPMEPPTGSQ